MNEAQKIPHYRIIEHAAKKEREEGDSHSGSEKRRKSRCTDRHTQYAGKGSMNSGGRSSLARVLPHSSVMII